MPPLIPYPPPPDMPTGTDQAAKVDSWREKIAMALQWLVGRAGGLAADILNISGTHVFEALLTDTWAIPTAGLCNLIHHVPHATDPDNEPGELWVGSHNATLGGGGAAFRWLIFTRVGTGKGSRWAYSSQVVPEAGVGAATDYFSFYHPIQRKIWWQQAASANLNITNVDTKANTQVAKPCAAPFQAVYSQDQDCVYLLDDTSRGGTGRVMQVSNAGAFVAQSAVVDAAAFSFALEITNRVTSRAWVGTNGGAANIYTLTIPALAVTARAPVGPVNVNTMVWLEDVQHMVCLQGAVGGGIWTVDSATFATQATGGTGGNNGACHTQLPYCAEQKRVFVPLANAVQGWDVSAAGRLWRMTATGLDLSPWGLQYIDTLQELIVGNTTVGGRVQVFR